MQERREDLDKQNVGRREIYKLFTEILVASMAVVSQDCDNTLSMCQLCLLAVSDEMNGANCSEVLGANRGPGDVWCSALLRGKERQCIPVRPNHHVFLPEMRSLTY